MLFAAIVTSSSDDKLRKAKDLGATHVINYKDRPDWDAEVLKITNRKGADIIVEIGGLGTMEQSLRAVAEGGNISAIGIVTGSTESKTQMTVGLQLIGRNSSIKGINIGPKDRMEEMLGLYLKRQIRPVVGRTFEFEDVKAAVRSMKDGDHFGKVVIKLD